MYEKLFYDTLVSNTASKAKLFLLSLSRLFFLGTTLVFFKKIQDEKDNDTDEKDNNFIISYAGRTTGYGTDPITQCQF
jgi:hypothetical protein